MGWDDGWAVMMDGTGYNGMGYNGMGYKWMGWPPNKKILPIVKYKGLIWPMTTRIYW